MWLQGSPVSITGSARLLQPCPCSRGPGPVRTAMPAQQATASMQSLLLLGPPDTVMDHTGAQAVLKTPPLPHTWHSRESVVNSDLQHHAAAGHNSSTAGHHVVVLADISSEQRAKHGPDAEQLQPVTVITQDVTAAHNLDAVSTGNGCGDGFDQQHSNGQHGQHQVSQSNCNRRQQRARLKPLQQEAQQQQQTGEKAHPHPSVIMKHLKSCRSPQQLADSVAQHSQYRTYNVLHASAALTHLAQMRVHATAGAASWGPQQHRQLSSAWSCVPQLACTLMHQLWAHRDGLHARQTANILWALARLHESHLLWPVALSTPSWNALTHTNGTPQPLTKPHTDATPQQSLKTVHTGHQGEAQQLGRQHGQQNHAAESRQGSAEQQSMQHLQQSPVQDSTQGGPLPQQLLPLLVDTLADAASQQWHDFNSQELPSLLYGLASLGYVPFQVSWLQGAVQHAHDLLPQMTAQGVANTLWAMSHWLQCQATNSASCFSQIQAAAAEQTIQGRRWVVAGSSLWNVLLATRHTAQHILQIGWQESVCTSRQQSQESERALAQLGATASHFLSQFWHISQSHLAGNHQSPSQQQQQQQQAEVQRAAPACWPAASLAVVCWSLATMRVVPPPSWVHALHVTTFPVLPSLNAHDTAHIAWAHAHWVRCLQQQRHATETAQQLMRSSWGWSVASISSIQGGSGTPSTWHIPQPWLTRLTGRVNELLLAVAGTTSGINTGSSRQHDLQAHSARSADMHIAAHSQGGDLRRPVARQLTSAREASASGAGGNHTAGLHGSGLDLLLHDTRLMGASTGAQYSTFTGKGMRAGQTAAGRRHPAALPTLLWSASQLQLQLPELCRRMLVLHVLSHPSTCTARECIELLSYELNAAGLLYRQHSTYQQPHQQGQQRQQLHKAGALRHAGPLNGQAVHTKEIVNSGVSLSRPSVSMDLSAQPLTARLSQVQFKAVNRQAPCRPSSSNASSRQDGEMVTPRLELPAGLSHPWVVQLIWAASQHLLHGSTPHASSPSKPPHTRNGVRHAGRSQYGGARCDGMPLPATPAVQRSRVQLVELVAALGPALSLPTCRRAWRSARAGLMQAQQQPGTAAKQQQQRRANPSTAAADSARHPDAARGQVPYNPAQAVRLLTALSRTGLRVPVADVQGLIALSLGPLSASSSSSRNSGSTIHHPGLAGMSMLPHLAKVAWCAAHVSRAGTVYRLRLSHSHQASLQWRQVQHLALAQLRQLSQASAVNGSTTSTLPASPGVPAATANAAAILLWSIIDLTAPVVPAIQLAGVKQDTSACRATPSSKHTKLKPTSHSRAQVQDNRHSSQPPAARMLVSQRPATSPLLLPLRRRPRLVLARGQQGNSSGDDLKTGVVRLAGAAANSSSMRPSPSSCSSAERGFPPSGSSSTSGAVSTSNGTGVRGSVSSSSNGSSTASVRGSLNSRGSSGLASSRWLLYSPQLLPRWLQLLQACVPSMSPRPLLLCCSALARIPTAHRQRRAVHAGMLALMPLILDRFQVLLSDMDCTTMSRTAARVAWLLPRLLNSPQLVADKQNQAHGKHNTATAGADASLQAASLLLVALDAASDARSAMLRKCDAGCLHVAITRIREVVERRGQEGHTLPR